MGPFDNSAGAVTFWLFVLTISVVGTIMPYLKHRESQRTIRTAIDKGQPIDPALLTEPKADQSRPEGYILGGAVMVAIGVGMQALGVAVTLQAGETIYPIFAVGVVVALVGAVLIGFGRWQLKRRG